MSCCGNCKKDKNSGEAHASKCCGGNSLPRYTILLSAIVCDELEQNVLLFQQEHLETKNLLSLVLDTDSNLEETLAQQLMELTNLEIASIQFNASYLVAEEQLLAINFVCYVQESMDLCCDAYGLEADWVEPQSAKELLEENSLGSYFFDKWLNR